MSKKSTHDRNSGKYKNRVPEAAKYYIAFDDQQVFEIMNKIREAGIHQTAVDLAEMRCRALISPGIDTRHAICRPEDASREDDDENIPDEEFEEVDDPLARHIFTGHEAFSAFLAQVRTCHRRDKGDLLTLFLISISVRLKEGRPINLYGTAPFADHVFCDARVSAVDRPKLWIKRELNSIVELMVSHGA